jgi:apolipoprotein N-acyltransferase
MEAAHAVIDRPQASASSASVTRLQWLRPPVELSLLAALLLWAALPPLNLSWLGWIAPIPLLVLAQQPVLGGRRPYLQIWIGGFVFWLAAVYWLTLPHPATSLGWLALSFYLGLYWPVFVGLLRVAIHRLNLSVLLAAPLIYLGLELARDHLLTGFLMTGLGHSQYRWTTLAQVADLAGLNGLSALMIFVAACATRMLPLAGRRAALWPLAPLAAAFALALGYGAWRLSQQTTRPGPTVALIQGSIDITMKMDPGQNQRTFDQYVGLTRRAIEIEPRLDLVVWPETMFRYPWLTFAEDFQPPAAEGWSVEQAQASSQAAIRDITGWLQVPILLGIDTIHYTPAGMDRYNSALIVYPGSRAGGRYDKVHRVMFGEYVPLAEQFPWLYKLTPLPGGLNRGAGPATIEVGSVRYAPDICFESTVSHLIRGQVNTLAARGEEPDVLVNLTNDGWFWGSSELEMHLSCEAFRAIECRKPFLIAANTGISAWIDSSGRVLEQGPRRETDVIIARTQLDSRRSPYLVVGDWPAGVCLALCVGLAWIGWSNRRRSGDAR